jgi:hypothetical protein
VQEAQASHLLHLLVGIPEPLVPHLHQVVVVTVQPTLVAPGAVLTTRLLDDWRVAASRGRLCLACQSRWQVLPLQFNYNLKLWRQYWGGGNCYT